MGGELKQVPRSSASLSLHHACNESHAPSKCILIAMMISRLTQEPIGTHNAKPHPGSPFAQKAAFIKDKYELRKYVRSLDPNVAHSLMWQAAFEVCKQPNTPTKLPLKYWDMHVRICGCWHILPSFRYSVLLSVLSMV